MHRQWMKLFSTSMLAIAMAFNVPSYAGTVEQNVFKAHLIPVLESDGRQPMVTFGNGTIRIKKEGVRVEFDMDEISAPDGTSGELQLTLKINGNRELVTLPFDVTSGLGEMGKATLKTSLLETFDVIKPGDAVEMRRARITINGELVGTIGFLAEEEAVFAGGEASNVGEAMVEAIEILILESFPVQVHVIAEGHLPDGCTQIDQVSQQRNGMTFTITVTTSRPPQALCTLAIVPFEEVIVLDVLGLAAGVYTVEVNNDVTASFFLEVDNFPVMKSTG